MERESLNEEDMNEFKCLLDSVEDETLVQLIVAIEAEQKKREEK